MCVVFQGGFGRPLHERMLSMLCKITSTALPSRTLPSILSSGCNSFIFNCFSEKDQCCEEKRIMGCRERGCIVCECLEGSTISVGNEFSEQLFNVSKDCWGLSLYQAVLQQHCSSCFQNSEHMHLLFLIVQIKRNHDQKEITAQIDCFEFQNYTYGLTHWCLWTKK